MEPADPLPEVTVGGDSGPKKAVLVRRPGNVPPAVPQIETLKRKATFAFGKRMLLRRMQSLIVTLNEGDAQGGPPTVREAIVTVQPIVPGALVTPALADISAMPGSSVRFTVVPLVHGKLRDARVELRHRGKTVDSTVLPMKVTRRCFAKFLLLLAVLFTALLAYDRHVSKWEPSYTQEILAKFDPPQGGGGPRPGGGIGPPPLPNVRPGEDPRPKFITFRGEKGIEMWVQENVKKSEGQWNSGNGEFADVVVLGIGWAHSWKFGADESEGEKGRSIFAGGFMLWETLRNIPMAEVYVGALLIGIALIVWFITGASRGRRSSKVFELAVA